LLGDDIVPEPSFNATRAISINAPTSEVYPWIVQIGMTRAGWYSYDLLDNLGRPSSQKILPEFQHISEGDVIPMSPDGKSGMIVKEIRENEALLWWDGVGDSSWLWSLDPIPGGTRLLTRVRVKYRWLSTAILFNLIIEFFDIAMMRKCMVGIKHRAESTSRSAASR
jgi:hypothetical protein